MLWDPLITLQSEQNHKKLWGISFPASLTSPGPTLHWDYIRFSKSYYQCNRLFSSRHRLLNVPDMQCTTHCWKGIGRSVGPACIGQAGGGHPIQCILAWYLRNDWVKWVQQPNGYKANKPYYRLRRPSALDAGGSSTPRPSRFTPGKRPGAHCIRGWVSSRFVLDGCGKSRPPPDSILGPSTP